MKIEKVMIQLGVRFKVGGGGGGGGGAGGGSPPW